MFQVPNLWKIPGEIEYSLEYLAESDLWWSLLQPHRIAINRTKFFDIITAKKLPFNRRWHHRPHVQKINLIWTHLQRIRKFAVEAAADENLSKKWFPTCENEHEINLQHKKKYIEFGAETKRLYNSPLHYMRRLLNEEAALWCLWFFICNMTILYIWQKIYENCCK